MGWYGTILFPRLMDLIMSGPAFQRLRQELLQPVHGDVLEIGLGTGLNLPHYPAGVTRLRAVEPATMLPDRLTARRNAAAFPIDIIRQSAETLPFPDCAFDFVISTWTLCTISDPRQALREIRRVLKPAGQFLFLEHGRSDEAQTAAWQDRLNPIQNVIGCGCNLNRPIDRLIASAGFRIERLDRFVMEETPKIVGTMYRGAAVIEERVTGPSSTPAR
ncbi:MAG: class I SAM-dependent methyltransferase [Nitrospira sp.]